MKRPVITATVDTILLFAVTALFGCILMGYFTKDTAVIVTGGILISLSVTGLVRILKKRRTPDITKQEFDSVFLQFFCGGGDFCFTFVCDAFLKRYPSLEKRNGYFIVNRTAVFVYFNPQPLPLTELFRFWAAADKTEVNGITVLTAAGAASGANALESLPIPVTIFSGEDSFRALRALESLPEIKIAYKKRASGLKTFFFAAFAPKNAKRYLLTALFFIGSSFIFPMSVYYIVCGALCLGLAALAGSGLVKRKLKSEN